MLDGLRTGRWSTTPLATILLQTVDALRHLVAAAVKGTDELLPEHLELLEDLMIEAGAGRTRVPRRALKKNERPAAPAGAQIRPALARRRSVEIEKLDRMLNLTASWPSPANGWRVCSRRPIA